MKNGVKAIMRQEILRKLIHMSSIFTIFVARYSVPLVILATALFTLFYLFTESVRLMKGGQSLLTQIVALTRRGNEVLRPALGPVTLALGLMISFLLFPPVAARIAVTALALGDGIASLIGRLLGRIRPKWLMGKSIEGSLSCLMIVFAATMVLTRQNLVASLVIAIAVTILEALPLGSLDNIALPMVAGIISYHYGY